MAALIGSLIACEAPPVSVPVTLTGTWTTDDERYVGRALRITTDSVVFHTGSPRDGPTAFAIVSIEVEEIVDGRRLYDIGYAQEGRLLHIGLVQEPLGGSMRLENRPAMVWRRAPAVPLRPPVDFRPLAER